MAREFDLVAGSHVAELCLGKVVAPQGFAAPMALHGAPNIFRRPRAGGSSVHQSELVGGLDIVDLC